MSAIIAKEAVGESAIISRIRSICEDNASDEVLESLRLQSIKFSQDYESGSFKRLSASNHGSGDGANKKKSFFSPRKRFHDHVSSINRSNSIECLNLEMRQLVHESNSSYDGNYSEHTSRIVIGDSDDGVYNSANRDCNSSINPMHRFLNFCYRQLSSIRTQDSVDEIAKEESESDDIATSRSFSSETQSFQPHFQKHTSDDAGYTESDCEEYCIPISNRKNSANDSVKHCIPHRHLLSDNFRVTTEESLSTSDGIYADKYDYSFVSKESSCTFHLQFDKTLSKISESIASLIPEKLLINKFPFLIGFDKSCDLVISKCKYIYRKHCKLTFENTFSENSEKDNIFRYRVGIVKCDKNAVVYINNVLLHDTAILKNEDILLLGSKSTYIGFRVVFNSYNDCLSLKALPFSFSSGIENDILSISTTLTPNTFDNQHKRDVIVLVFEVLCNDMSFLGMTSRKSSLSDNSDVSMADPDLNDGDKTLSTEFEKIDEHDPNILTNGTGLYRLQSPTRLTRDVPFKNPHAPWDSSPSASPSSFERMAALKQDNISPGSDMLLNAYADVKTSSSTSTNVNPEKTDEQGCTYESDTVKHSKDKILLFKSLNSTDVPIIVDSETGTTGNITPKEGEVHTINCIGVINASNNMLIHEMLPDIEKLLRVYHCTEEYEEEYGMNLYDIIIKHYSDPINSDSLSKSWVFQLDYVDWDNPHLRRAVTKNGLLSDEIKNNVNRRSGIAFEANKYRVIYIRRKNVDNFKL